MIEAALDAAAVSLERARARNVPQADVSGRLSRLGPARRLVLWLYDRVFVVQREIDADQNDALVALTGALRELQRLLRE